MLAIFDRLLNLAEVGEIAADHELRLAFSPVLSPISSSP